jgi:tetratricopeptide (TPR) repeat protein
MTDRADLAEILDEYLVALEAGNPPDRDALLAKHPELAEELEAALLGVDFVYSAAPRLAPDEHADTLPGRSLGDYRLLRELGRGGMAVVYEAEQISLGRRVALKVLPFAAVLDPKQLQRFKNEALAAAHLHHAHIVPVYGVGCERGVHYYAMQYVEGQSLATAIRELKGGGTGEEPKTPISSHGSNREPAYIRMAAELGVQAAEALDHAHQLGIVHRDIKPGNLLVDLVGTLWVTDFGVASSVANVGLTMTGELLGTIRYMSPEQALAKRAPIDHRTDVYSLGATLYELFTLEPAFPGDDPHVVIHDIATKEPVLPRRLNSAIPSDLETVLLKAMSKEPAHRYATALEMAEDLTHFLENRPIEAKRPGLVRRASQWSRRHRTLVGATAALLLLSTAGLATGTALLWREQAHTKAAFGTAQANLDLALQALDQIYIDEVGGHPKIRDGLPKDLLQKGLGFYEKFITENARNKGLVILLASAYQRAGLIFRALGEEARAVEFLNRAISAYDQALESNPRDTRATHNRGVALSDLGRFEEALAAHDRTLEIDPLDADAHNSRGTLLCDHLGRPGEALAEFDRTIEINPRYPSAHSNRGNALNSLGRTEEALAASDRAVELEPQGAGVHNSRAGILYVLKRFEEALAACDRAIALDPRHFLAHANRGAVLAHMKRFDDALEAYDRALQIDPRSARVHNLRGDALFEAGRFEQALAAYDRAVEFDLRYSAAHANRGDVLRELGRFADSLAAYDRAVEIDPGDVKAQNGRGVALQFLGRYEEALEAYDRASKLDPRNALIHLNRGAVLCDYLGRPAEALAAFDLAIEIDPQDARAQQNRSVALTAIEHAERMAELEGRLDQVLSGKARPRDAVEQTEFALMLYKKARHGESARMFAEAFAEDAALAEDLAQNHRYNAACSAALAAAAGGADAAEWRGRALEWLRADLAAREKAVTGLAAMLEQQKKDPDFASVRDHLGDLPEPERDAWRGLWAAVDLALANALPAAK